MALYKFKLPKFSELSDDQKVAVNTPESIALTGGPGTGKSVVSVWRHIYNLTDLEKKSLLLTYTKTLQQALNLITDSAIKDKEKELGRKLNISPNVKRTQKTEYNISDLDVFDEIIIDEAQDNPCSFYELLKDHADSICYGADNTQILYPDRACNNECFQNKHSDLTYNIDSIKKVKESCLFDIFSNNEPVALFRNYRNTYEVMCFVRSLFPERNVISFAALQELKGPGEFERRGPKPVYHITERNSYNEEINRYEYSNQQQDSFIKDIIEEYHADGHNIVILVPFQNEVDYFFQKVESFDFTCSMFSANMEVIDDIQNIHITTLKSAKGLEFDTVIIPNFQKIKENLTRFNIEENDYYVAVTRAKRNLYLIASSTISHLDSNTFTKEG
ncbi:MAG: hypothetical protein A2W98_09470 [Bacteroidetes bacterium GWF2_33_38]|nr:MAG: hypothetical protein A2W98_09470 [Bacteroidetes bacterium GWF2_33_38]OFY88099.1 MAG: hypothetical protein A2236_13060 [Bacteroidetes bacterium RIFOXYA2_FULL_33_7]HBX51477.1 hypothetical protein [Bacteroidales bacterium]